MKTKTFTSRERRHARVRAKIRGTSKRPRFSIFRSHKHVWAQIIDDQAGTTMAAASDTMKDRRKQKKIERALEMGKALAEKALSVGVTEVVFDRGGYKYHGRVKAVAEGARAGGLKF